ncbi:MAG: VTT domain-containing protein [Aeromicrobium sp.]|uniref:VTT domain-containing protein n=1 Tax=Aeromicrobium sp. TaxID=1871063 RepID=UPI0025BCBAFB|nr:VTT domain-containing protein [Aeromicrobium sp.]MCK5891618.1 VTT domain-containing protein [Aeromicrobium sp.]MDF1704858.1 VTT domain-containing protein [Aeromicrobium sp.]
MTALLTPALLVLGPLALLLVIAVVFAETGLLVGFFLPGDSLLFITGALVAGGVIHLPIWLVAAAVCVAAAAGDQVGYLVGRRWGPRVFARPESRLFRHEHVAVAEEFFVKHGPVAVIAARFVPVVRTFTPVVAGVALMRRRRFTTYNVVGALVWGTGIVMTGFFFGAIAFVAQHIELITMGLAACSLAPAAFAVLRGRRRRRAVASPPAVQSGDVQVRAPRVAP